ncbi:MAG: non-homologous end-joining DNA ligase [Oscillospiraceae bacterium]|nr:non-homologous end-joining DNA ligase [Oscillospiraceae bacterium]
MKNNLHIYNQKRNFDKTDEPYAETAREHSEATEPRRRRHYVIQYHEASRKHYDLRLEMNGVLRSWAVPKEPSLTEKRLAIQVEDHPLEYRHFEGTIPKGQYGGGTVVIWDKGTYDLHTRSENSITFTLHGERLTGKWSLVRMDDKNWLLQSAGAAATAPALMLCKLAKQVPQDDDWVFELKYDGWRVLSVVENGQASLQTRNGNDCTQKFKAVARELAKLDNCVIDGEMLLKPQQYIAFDLLSLNGNDLRDTPLLQRKAKLENLLANAPDSLQYSQHWTENGQQLFNQACAAGLEGIIAKRADGLYTGKREWIKIKCEGYKRGVEISSPDKIFSTEPHITKQDLADYYQAVAPRMLPYIEHRLITAIRCPGGAAESCFYKKNPQLVITSAEELLAEVQQNTVEFHAWGSRIDALEQPDMMVFDLDPDEGLALEQVRQGARDLKKILDKLGLKSYLKTSGGKGYHVVVPMLPAQNWQSFRDMAKGIVDAMVETWPEKYTANVRKANRKGKIFVDWIRNTRSATSVAPYSVRMRPGMPVSCPIAWSELPKVAPDGIDMVQALKRLKRKDPWEGVFMR